MVLHRRKEESKWVPQKRDTLGGESGSKPGGNPCLLERTQSPTETIGEGGNGKIDGKLPRSGPGAISSLKSEEKKKRGKIEKEGDQTGFQTETQHWMGRSMWISHDLVGEGEICSRKEKS